VSRWRIKKLESKARNALKKPKARSNPSALSSTSRQPESRGSAALQALGFGFRVFLHFRIAQFLPPGLNAEAKNFMDRKSRDEPTIHFRWLE
jgi:hypothetical protein